MTILELFNKLTDIANSHIDVQNTKNGVIDKLETGDYNYPLVNFHIGESNNINIPNNEITIVVTVLDFMNKQLDNEINVTSKCFQIGIDILSQLEYNYNYQSIEIDSENISWEQAVGQTSDFLGGVQLFVPVKISSDFSGCN